MEHVAIALITAGLLCLLWANVQLFQELSELRKLLGLHRKRMDNQGSMISLTAAHVWPEKREELLATLPPEVWAENSAHTSKEGGGLLNGYGTEKR